MSDAGSDYEETGEDIDPEDQGEESAAPRERRSRGAAQKAVAKFQAVVDDEAFERALKADELRRQKRKDEAAARPKKKKAPPKPVVEYVVEAILDVKKAWGGHLVYLVKWRGFDESDNTWEPEDEESQQFGEYIEANGAKIEAAKAAEPPPAPPGAAVDEDEDVDVVGTGESSKRAAPEAPDGEVPGKRRAAQAATEIARRWDDDDDEAFEAALAANEAAKEKAAKEKQLAVGN
jgi:hypothetical protein